MYITITLATIPKQEQPAAYRVQSVISSHETVVNVRNNFHYLEYLRIRIGITF